METAKERTVQNVGKEFYSLKDYLAEGRLLMTDEPVMMVQYMGIIGTVKTMECFRMEKAVGDLEPLMKALKEVEVNGTDDAKAALRFVDHMGASKRASSQGKEFVEHDYIFGVEGMKDFRTLEKYSKMVAGEDARNKKALEEQSEAVVIKRTRQWADEFTERAAADLKTAEEYEKAGNPAAAHEMREEARKNLDIAEEMRMHLESGTLFTEE